MNDLIQKTMDGIFAQWNREKPFEQRMDDLYRENLNLLDQERELETEMKEKRNLIGVWKVRTKIAPIRAKIEKNKEEISNILGRLIAGV